MNITEFKKACLTRPADFACWDDKLDFEVWGIAPFSVHRDSEILDQSNWAVISEDLMKRFPKSFDIFRASHSAVGWMEHLIIKTSNRKAVKAAFEWCERLDDYPVADEDDFSNREYEEACEAWDAWAGSDVRSLIEQEEISFLIDEDGDYAATEEQEEVIKGVLVTHLLGNDGLKEDRLVEDIHEAFKDIQTKIDDQTLAFDF